MELRHLRYFVAVVEEQSFTKASERLFIAQPPLSRQIQNLETELGLQLFERGSRPLKTTEAGQFFYQNASKLLSNVEELKRMTKRIGSPDRTINIGFVGSLLFGLLSNIVNIIKQKHPNIKIEMIELTTTQQIKALKEGKIDVGFGRLRISDPEVKRILIRNERLMVAVHESHPFASYKNGVYLADIINEQIFLYPNQNKPNFSTQVLGIFSEYGLKPQDIREVRELQLALGFVAANIGICVVPSSAQSIHLEHLKYIPILDEFALSPIFMAVRHLDQSEDIHSLFEIVHKAYELNSNGLDQLIP